MNMSTESCPICKTNFGTFRHVRTIYKGQTVCSDCQGNLEKQEQAKREREIAQVVVTTTDTVQGYKILKYLGVVDASAKSFSDAVQQLRVQAQRCGGNAVVGIQFNSLGYSVPGGSLIEFSPERISHIALGTVVVVTPVDG
jgi:uncharacterized protein YbjQ (UPF0145 family)